MSNTAVVLCTYHRTMEGGGLENILKFQKENIPNFSLLFDNQKGLSIDDVKSTYNGVDICPYDDSDFKKYGFDKPISTFHFWGAHQNPKYFYAHFRMLTYYIKNPNFDHYWFFDDDVQFDKNLKGFLELYNDVKEDFLAIIVFKKEDYKEFPKVNLINDRMLGSKGYWLGHCPGDGDKFKSKDRHMGSFFPVVRLSNKAMKHLLEVHQQGFYGYSEGFVPTTLASDGFSVASMQDEFNKYFEKTNDCILNHKGGPLTWEWL